MLCVAAISPFFEMGIQQFPLSIALSDFWVRSQNAIFVLITVYMNNCYL
jgi:hypothetical protein